MNKEEFEENNKFLFILNLIKDKKGLSNNIGIDIKKIISRKEKRRYVPRKYRHFVMDKYKEQQREIIKSLDI